MAKTEMQLESLGNRSAVAIPASIRSVQTRKVLKDVAAKRQRKTLAVMSPQAKKDYAFACDMVECGEFETADMVALGMISAEEYAQVRAESAATIGWIGALDEEGFTAYLKGVITTEQARARAFGMMGLSIPGVEMTLEETALALGGLTRERARQLENNALAKCRRKVAWMPIKPDHLGDMEQAHYYRSRPVACSSAD